MCDVCDPWAFFFYSSSSSSVLYAMYWCVASLLLLLLVGTNHFPRSFDLVGYRRGTSVVPVAKAVVPMKSLGTCIWKQSAAVCGVVRDTAIVPAE